MTRVSEWILLAAIPGLMFCIMPIPGFEFRLSWQLAAIWLGGLAFASLLASPWHAAFWLVCLVVQTRYLPPAYDAYMGLVMIAIFLAAAEGFSRIEKRRILVVIRLAALALICWICLQETGIAKTWFAPQNAGPFNPDTGGIFLAICLPAFLSGWWLLMVPVILWGIVVAKTTTGMLAALAAVLVYLFMAVKNRRVFMASCGAAGFAAAAWFWKVKALGALMDNVRWVAWKHALWSLRSEAFGRGIESWPTVFPLLASGDPAAGKVVDIGGMLIGENIFMHAHNEYVRVLFEIGLPGIILIAAFLISVAVCVWRNSVSPEVAAGVSALAVGCFGFDNLHIAPTALLGVAWLGMWTRETAGQNEGRAK
jgi:hypothetical protein